MPIIIAADQVREPIYAIVPLYNPWRFKSRYKHTMRAIKHFAESGAVVILVEVAFNRREFVFADCGLHNTNAICGIHGNEFKHKYIGLRTKDELWLKEAAINIGTMSLPYNWQQVMWLDSDIHFVRPNWVGEIIQKLQHYAFIQPFSHARDVGPNYELLPENYPHADGNGFVKAWMEDQLPIYPAAITSAIAPEAISDYSTYFPVAIPTPTAEFRRVWPGLAWACTRQAWDAVGGLQDFHVWGGGDWVMAWALIEQTDWMLRKDLHPNYKQLAMAWLDSCKRYIRRNVGQVEGSIFHYWHGPKPQRGYNNKHKLLADIGFDPLRHLKRDYQGLWQLNDLGEESYIKLRDTMRAIAKERNEDSNHVPDYEPVEQ